MPISRISEAPTIYTYPTYWYIGDPTVILNQEALDKIFSDRLIDPINYICKASNITASISYTRGMAITKMGACLLGTTFPVNRENEEFMIYRSNFGKDFLTKSGYIAILSSSVFTTYTAEGLNPPYEKDITHKCGRFQWVKNSIKMHWSGTNALNINIDGGHKIIQIHCLGE